MSARRRGRRTRATWALAAAALLPVMSGTAWGQSASDFADWTQLTGSPRAVVGTLHGNSVSVEGTGVAASSTLDGSNTIFDRPAFTPPLPTSDTVDLSAVTGNTYTLSFGAATTDPVLHVASLASTLTFTPGTVVTRVSGDANFAVSGSDVIGGPGDGNGTVRLEGTFSTIEFTTSSMFVTDGIYLQVGARPAVPPDPSPTPSATPAPPVPPTPDTPPPGPGPGPENVRAPEIAGAGGGISTTGFAYRCDPGEWRNLATPPGYAFAWRVQGSTRVEARTRTWTPPASVYGFPVVCDVTVPGPDGPVTATSAPSVFSSAGADRVPEPYGDVRIRGIDVFQVTQPNAGAFVYGYRPDAPFFGLCGAGTPTAYRGDTGRCELSGRNPQSVLYDGVTLDTFKPTTAFVYVDVAGATPTDPDLGYDLVLSAFNADRLPLDAAPVIVRVKNPPRSDTPWVQHFERDNVVSTVTGDRNTHAIAIQLPYAWRSTARAIRLEAELRFDAATSPGRSGYGIVQCETGDCATNDRFTLRSVPFLEFPALRIASLALEDVPDQPLPSPFEVLRTAMTIYPGGAGHRVLPYQGTLDISGMPQIATPKAETEATDDYLCGDGTTVVENSRSEAVRSCRWNHVALKMREWSGRFPARDPRRVYDVLFGVHDYQMTPAGLNEPGTAHGTITAVSRSGPSSAGATPVFTADATIRPLTAAAHELGHVLTAPHASGCDGAAGYEEWPENSGDLDRRGRLQSTKFRAAPPGGGRNQLTVARPSFAAGPQEWFRDGSELFDLMSYCAGGDTATSDGSAWLSARNWNRVGRELRAMGARLESRVATRAVATTAETGFAVGSATGASGTIARVVPPREGQTAPASVPGSPYRLRSLDAARRVLLDAGVTVGGNAEAPGAGGTFVGPVAARATTVELVRDGTVLDRIARTQPPVVELVSTRLQTRVLVVRWNATDPDGDELAATVDFSADDGETWRPLRIGGSTGSATIPRAMLAGSTRARVRVTVNDGFTETQDTSAPFTVPGTAPQARIAGPESGAVVQAGDRVTLRGSAVDDTGAELDGRSLTWFAGSTRLGTGNRLQTRLPRGTRVVRLRAVDRNGLTGQARAAVRVVVPRLHVVAQQVPRRVGRRARTVRVRLATSAPATLVVGARRYRVDRRPRTLTVPLPRRPATGIVSVAFRVVARGGLAAGTVRGRFAVARV